MRVTIPSGDHLTLVEVTYPSKLGEHEHRIGLRGSHAPLSWEHTHYPEEVRDDLHIFRVRVPRGEILELKVVRNEDDWASGRNYAVHGGDHLHIAPAFDRGTSRIEPCIELTGRDGAIPVEVLLPPSYDEHPRRNYSVLYALDGQALFSTSNDPYGVWNIERSLDALYDLSAIEELIVVGVHTAQRRLERLSPVADPHHGGGDGRAFLDDLINIVHGHVASRYRVGDDHGILGSSMGGLFAFFAAWTRPDFFRRAACLSSSFWWSNRWAPRFVAASEPPAERPVIYLDSGAARDPTDPDPNVRDGFHHSRSMFRALTRVGYTPGTELHRMVFPGHAHEPAAWGSRVSTPLQLLYPTPNVTPFNSV